MSEEQRPVVVLPSKPNGPQKVCDQIAKAMADNQPFFSFEYFPPKTPAGVENLYVRIEKMTSLEPMFIDVTWGAGGTTSDLTFDIASTAQANFGPEVVMHLTCTNISVDSILDVLNKCRAVGIRNILALRGDPPVGQDRWEQTDGGLRYATDLVKLIRREHGDWFCIFVAGYSEGHLESTNLDDDMIHLKEKVDAGADGIITQLFYDVPLWLSWVEKCRAAGITVPIIPGIMPIQSYAGWKRMTGFCKTIIPPEIAEAMDKLQQDDAAVKKYGIDLAADMCQQLLESGVPGVHLYTLNLETSCIHIIEKMNMIAAEPSSKTVPWQSSQLVRRQKEAIRPIFWANRPNSYVRRTNTWDFKSEFDFPNGRWSSHASPAFGELKDFHLCPFSAGSNESRREMWGHGHSTLCTIYEIFADFCSGKIARLPWCDVPLSLESLPLIATLEKLNRAGILTINSQPRINGVHSNDKVHGWGPDGGIVYQKAYLEFFISGDLLKAFLELVEQYPSLSFCALKQDGTRISNYKKDDQVTAVTWGVFPDCQILQPTVVDGVSFMAWKDEAFALWISQWQTIYDPTSLSYELIQNIHDTYYLVNLVDNDYITGDIFQIFYVLLQQQATKSRKTSNASQ